MIMNDWYDIGLFQQHVSSYEDVKVYFHADGQYLDFSGRMGYFIRKKDKVQSQVNTYELRLSWYGFWYQCNLSTFTSIIPGECQKRNMMEARLVFTRNTTNACTKPW